MQYTAAGNFTLGGFTPATSYNCSISASNIWGNGPVAYKIVSTLDACKHCFLEVKWFIVQKQCYSKLQVLRQYMHTCTCAQ